ncbi:MAG: acyl carrier protein [Anaerolineaceae bacterium]
MTTSQTIEQRVITVIATVFKKEEKDLSGETFLVKDLQAKSMNMIELQAVLESEFEVELPLYRIMRAKTVSDLIVIVNETI